MQRQVFINLPVHDLERSRLFFSSLGFQFEPRFTTENAACLVVAENVFVMLLVEEFFRCFTRKGACDTGRHNEVSFSLSCDSREQVDELVSKAELAGARVPRDPEDRGFMYGHAFEDCDGHLWELIYLSPAPAAAVATEAA